MIRLCNLSSRTCKIVFVSVTTLAGWFFIISVASYILLCALERFRAFTGCAGG